MKVENTLAVHVILLQPKKKTSIRIVYLYMREEIIFVIPVITGQVQNQILRNISSQCIKAKYTNKLIHPDNKLSRSLGTDQRNYHLKIYLDSNNYA